MRILTFTTLYPNAAQPSHGIFVENRLRHLAQSTDVRINVIAPVPWFPFRHKVFGRYGTFAKVPSQETRHGLKVYHPRFPLIPKIGMRFAPDLLAAAIKPKVEKLVDRLGGVDLIDAHYFYPDGVAAAIIAKELDLPLVVTGRGTDLSLIPEFPGPRRKIQQVIERCDAMVTVCAALAEPLKKLGAPDEKINVLRNGVDLEMFRQLPRDACRNYFGVDGFVLASVGLLIERKGHHLIIEALKELPQAILLIAGDGPGRSKLESLCETFGVADRVKFLGNVPHETLVKVYNAADILVLASSREGWANVLLESMACGTPVAATDIWGTPEVVADPAAGRLIPERTATAIAEIILKLKNDLPDRDSTRRYAEQFSWDETSERLFSLFQNVLKRNHQEPDLL